MSTAFVITGRSVKDWQLGGSAPPPDVVWTRCIGCDQDVTISADGARKMAEAKRDGMDPCGALCTPCLLIFAADGRNKGKVAGVTASDNGLALLERSAAAREIADVIRSMKAKP